VRGHFGIHHEGGRSFGHNLTGVREADEERSVMDVAHAEAVEKELNNFIERRSRKDPDADEREELWKESVRRYNARRDEEMRAAWYGWHLDQAERHRRTLEGLIAHHETQAERLCEEG
jgi:hypothetical protein